MKLRPELLLAIALAAGVGWLLLAQRAPRGAVSSDRGTPALHSGEEPAVSELAAVPVLPPSQVLVPSPEGESGAPAGREAQPPAPAAQPGSARSISRGLLVDAATLEPIPDALVATSMRNDWTDAGGWFDTGDALDGLDDIVVANVMMDTTSTHEVPRSSWTRLADAWRVPIAIGPTYRLRFRDVALLEGRTWEGRIQRETGADDLWHRLRPGPPPYLRYDDPLRQLVPGEEVWLEVRSTDGLHEGRGEVAALVGIHEIEIDCRARAVLSGRVVDEDGLPWHDLDLDALQISAGAIESLRARTGTDGSYHFSAREPGRMQVVLQPPAETRTRKLGLAVPLGLTRAPDMVVARRTAGSVSGLVRCRNKEVLVLGGLRLRALDGSGYEAFSEFDVGGRWLMDAAIGEVPSHGPATDTAEFRFEDVPAGDFELSAVSNNGFACTPQVLRVCAPSEGHVFFFENAVELRPYVLELVDAESGAVLEGARAEVRVGGTWSDRPAELKTGLPLVRVADGVSFEWCVIVPGYRLASGSERDFHLEQGTMVAKRELRRGFGVRLCLVEQSDGPLRFELRGGRRSYGTVPVAGAAVLADGEVVATSDANGIAELGLPRPPARIEVRLAGWRVLDSREFAGGAVRSFPSAEVRMVRE